MSSARWMQGDVFAEMAKIPDGSVDLLCTSPPFLALRSYLPADHPLKHLEIGSEGTPAAYLTVLLALTREWRRILAPHGSLCVELGDTYSGAGGDNHLYEGSNPAAGFNGSRDQGALPGRKRATSSGWPLDKSLCLLPTLYPASLAYGRNLLQPDDVIEPWRIRNVIVWHRPNPPVGALGDKVRPSTSYVTVACVRRDRWFDLDAERNIEPRGHSPQSPGGETEWNRNGTVATGRKADPNPAGAPPLDHWTLPEDDPEHQSWTIPTQPYAGSHYATFPIALPRRLIRLMCPMHVCRTCGEPRRRIVETNRPIARDDRQRIKHANGERPAVGRQDRAPEIGWEIERTTLGWSDCGHDNYRRGHVLDPFAGSGTTLAAATEQGRDATGIDIDEENYWLARQRIGMFLEGAS